MNGFDIHTDNYMVTAFKLQYTSTLTASENDAVSLSHVRK